MLNTIREKTQGIIATFILVLLVIPFALWGINSYFEGGPSNTVAKVDGTEISKQRYLEALERYRGRVDNTRYESQAFKELVLSGIIEQTLLLQDVGDAGYRLSDEQLAGMIHQVPIFQRNGRFDISLFRLFLRREGLSEQAFLAQLRGDITTRQVQVGLSETAIVASDEVNRLAQLMAQQRTVSWLRVDPGTFLARVGVSEDDVRRFYESKPELFKTPEEVRIQYVRLSVDDLKRRYKPTDAEIRKAYQDDIGRYTTPEKRRAAHILIALPPNPSPEQVEKANQRAEALVARLRAGSDFAALARQRSADKRTAARGGDLGEIKPGRMPKHIEAAANALRPGEISDPIQGPAGIHIIKLVSRAAIPKPLAAVRRQVIELLRKHWAEEKFAELGEKLRNLAYENPDSLAPVANTLELEIQQTPWFTRSGGQGLAKQLKVAEIAFSAELVGGGKNSDAIEIDRQTLVVIRVAGHRPSVLKPLDKIRPEIERHLRRQSSNQAAHSLALQLLGELRKGAEPTVLARRPGVELKPKRTISRDGSVRLDRRLMEAAFSASRPEKGKASYQLVDVGSLGPHIVILHNVTELPPDKLPAKSREQMRRALLERRGSGFYGQYQTGLRLQADVRIDKERL